MTEVRAATVGGRETAHRFAQRVKAERRRKRRRWLVAAAIVGILLGAGLVVLRSSLLKVEQIAVSGNRRQSADELLATAGVSRGAPMWDLDASAVRRRVLALPRVKAATVTRSWPRTVRITITERQPVAAVAPPTGGYLLVDSTGSEIERVQAAPAGLLPVRLVTPAAAASRTDPVADTAEARRPLVTGALAVAVALPPAVRARLSLIKVGSTEDLELVLTDGTLIRWGSAERSERKAVVLAALLKTPHPVYDVRAPESPAVR